MKSRTALKKVLRPVAQAAGACALGALSASAQSAAAPPDVWSHAAQLAKAHELASTAKQNNGAASAKLAEYPNHYTMMAFRSKSGGAEVHDHFADVFVIVKGSATLLTGGTVVDLMTHAPDEHTGTSLANAASKALRAGDVVHIPAGTPHQLVLPRGGTLSYFVIKVKES